MEDSRHPTGFALYLAHEGDDAQELFDRLTAAVPELGFRAINRGAYLALTEAKTELWDRLPFPGENPQDIQCPMCESRARTSADGTTFLCLGLGHYGYYEQSPGVTIAEAKWRLG